VVGTFPDAIFDSLSAATSGKIVPKLARRTQSHAGTALLDLHDAQSQLYHTE
jgi:hypothetical protein